MSTMNLVYIGGFGDSDNASAKLRSQFAQCEIIMGKAFIGADLPPDAWIAPEADLLDFSAELYCDVIWLSFQSLVDAFQFHHWRKGERLRALVFGCFREERTWERVEGTAEDWEQDAIFQTDLLDDLLEFADNDGEREEFRRIWRERELLPDRIYPSIDARETARAVAAYYDLPGL